VKRGFRAAAAAAGLLDSCSSSDGDGGGDRSWARYGFRAVGVVDGDRLPGSGSGLSALRLPPLKLPVSDDGSCGQTVFTIRRLKPTESWTLLCYNILFNGMTSENVTFYPASRAFGQWRWKKKQIRANRTGQRGVYDTRERRSL